MIEKPIVSVRSEINGNLCLWSDSADDLDIQHDLAVRPIRRTGGCVVAAVNRNGRDAGNGKAQRIKVFLDVGLPIAARKLEDGHALTVAVRARGEVIEFCDFVRGEGPCVARMRLHAF